MADTKLNNYISRGTNAERLAFTPSPPTPASGNHPSYIFYETDTANSYMWDGSAWQLVNNAAGSVTKTGSPASGNLAKFSGASSITNGDLSGDVTTSGTLATTLAASGVSAGTYGDGTHTLTLTVDAKGRVTAISTNAVTSGAMTLISEVVTSASQASVTFSSIATTYRDLLLVVRGRSTTTANTDSVIIQFNSDTTSGNYLYENTQASNSTGSSGATTSASFIYVGEIPAASATATFAGASEIRILDYRGTTFFKDILANSGAQANTALLTQRLWGAWKSTSAINAVKVFLNGAGNFVDGTVVSLYGLM